MAKIVSVSMRKRGQWTNIPCVKGNPLPGQCSVNLRTGVITFHGALKKRSVTIRYRKS